MLLVLQRCQTKVHRYFVLNHNFLWVTWIYISGTPVTLPEWDWDILEWYLECLSTEILITSGPSPKEEILRLKIDPTRLDKKKLTQTFLPLASTILKLKYEKEKCTLAFFLPFCCKLIKSEIALTISLIWHPCEHTKLSKL